jgi:hypothetical protein
MPVAGSETHTPSQRRLVTSKVGGAYGEDRLFARIARFQAIHETSDAMGIRSDVK